MYDHTAAISAILFFIGQSKFVVKLVNSFLGIDRSCPSSRGRLLTTFIFLFVVYGVNVYFYKIMDNSKLPSLVESNVNVLGAVEIKKAFANALFSGFIFYICSEPDLYEMLLPKSTISSLKIDCPDTRMVALETVVYYFAVVGFKWMLDR